MILQLHLAFAKALTLQLPRSWQVFQSEQMRFDVLIKKWGPIVNCNYSKITVYSHNHVAIPIKHRQNIQCNIDTKNPTNIHEQSFFTPPRLRLQTPTSLRPVQWRVYFDVQKTRTNNKCCMIFWSDYNCNMTNNMYSVDLLSFGAKKIGWGEHLEDHSQNDA